MSTIDFLQEDARNRQHALQLDSFIVEAPAGAGKTELLTQRYLKLLSVVDAPEEIIAITFTNKAAAEMRSRVLQRLQDAADGTPVEQPHLQEARNHALAALARAHERGWALLQQPGSLQIITIDALCGSLARQMPLMSRFGTQPKIAENAQVHYEEAARRTLAMVEDEAGNGPVTESLRYLHNDTQRLGGLLSQMLSMRDQWHSHTTKALDDTQMQAGLQRLILEDVASASEVLTAEVQAKLMPIARYAASHLPCEAKIALLVDWDRTIPATMAALPFWCALADLLLTSEDEFRKTVNLNQGFPANDESKPFKTALRDLIAALPSPEPLAKLRKCPSGLFTSAEQVIIQAMSQTLALAYAHLWTVFKEAGEVDFVEVTSRALQALEDDAGVTDLALRLDYRIRHLLVDEFQDTSPTQVALLKQLTQGWEPGDGRTLFCVGDPMQSIYRFRKADVGLFLQTVSIGIDSLKLKALKLYRNNRSCPSVIEWINRVFQNVFPRQDHALHGAISYRPFAASKPAQVGEGVVVHPLLFESGVASELVAAEEASYIANLIENEQAAYPDRKIAVLVRARAHLNALVAEIRRNRPKLSFQAVEIEQLAGRQSVQDVFSLTSALFHRADRLHWLAILRAPWCGLTLSDLHTLSADDHHATVWQLMQDEARVLRLTDDGQARLRHVRIVMAESYQHQGRQSPRRWVESAWLRLGGASCLWDDGDVRDVQAFFDLLDQLNERGRFDISLLEPAMQKLYAAPDAKPSNLQFMTIHKSKGLEFDTVILPGLDRQPNKSDTQLLLWEEVPDGANSSQLVVAPMVPKHHRDETPSVYDYLRGFERERDENESLRLLYVAATRAERRLHLIATVKLNTKGDVRPVSQSPLSHLWANIASEFEGLKPQTPATDKVENQSEFTPCLVRLTKPSVPLVLQMSETSIPAMATPAALSLSARSVEADCGTLAHRYMELMAKSGVTQWSIERLINLQSAMSHWLQMQGHTENDASVGAERVKVMLVNTLSSDAGRWVLTEHEEAESELTLNRLEGVEWATHIIDRTFIFEGERWIIDYKSTSHVGVGIEALEQEAENYRSQLERYASLFSLEVRPIRIAIYFIFYGRLIELPMRLN